MDLLAAATETLPIPAAVDLAAIVVGALTGGLLAAREGFAVSGVRCWPSPAAWAAG